jgi:hypothetical protein
MATAFSAIRMAISSPSMAQGPANRKKLLLSACFIWGMASNRMGIYFQQKYYFEKVNVIRIPN